MYILRSHSMLTLLAIAAYFDRHHTTVLSAITEVEKRILTDPDLGTFIEGITVSLGLQPYQ